MIVRALVCSFACLLLVGAPLSSQVEIKGAGRKPRKPETVESKVPLLADLPILGDLFRHQANRLWYPLPGRPGAYELSTSLSPEQRKSDDRPPYRDRWLQGSLVVKFPELDTVDIVHERTTRWRGDRSERSQRHGLEIVGPEAVLSKAKAFLDRVVAQRGHIVVLELHMIEGGPVGGERPGRGVPQVAVLDDADIQRLLRRVQTTQGAKIMASPRLSIFSGQFGNVTMVNQVSYVKDFDVEVVHGAAIADPVIDVISEGFMADVCPVIHEDGRTMSIDARISIASLQRPIDEFTTKLKGISDAKVTIQLPQVSYSTWRSKRLVLMPGDAGFIVRGLARMDGDWKKGPIPVDVLCRLRIVKTDSIEAPRVRIVGVDAAARTAFARWPRAAVPDLKPGVKLAAWRDRKRVATFTLKELQGQLGVLQIVEGLPRAGDAVR
ncbi:MAG: hypothetical protein CMJ83_22150 [Planctomycetes bacterium]|nr:hypothetical protein [Planctomycetota bacterium]